MPLRTHRLSLIAVTVVLTSFAAACGESGRPTSTGNVGDDAAATGARTVEVTMEDIRFEQTSLTVSVGETVDFRFTNNGKVPHDAFIGDLAAQTDHETEMAEMGGTAGHHMEEAAIVVQPGDAGQLSYTFDEPGTFQIGCHQPGHYAAGMKIDVTVE